MSKDNIEPAIFIADFAGKCIREKVMMFKPDKNDYYEPDYEQPGNVLFYEDEWNAAEKKYKAHVASRRTYPYPVKQEQDGKELRENIDFKIVFIDMDEKYNDVFKAIPIEPEGLPDKPYPLKDKSKRGVMNNADEVWEEIIGYIETQQFIGTKYKIVIEQLKTAYKISEPSSKEQEGDISDTISKLYSMIDYWKKRCLLAEFIVLISGVVDCEGYEKWQELKNQQP